jgi:PAS domain S-box-containing protein
MAELRDAVARLHVEVAERERAHDALRASEQRYRELVETIHDVVFTLDADGLLTYLSPAFEAISGYRSEEMLGRPFTDLIHPDDLEAALSSFRQSIAGTGRPFECRAFTKSGAERWVRTSSRLARDANGGTELRGVLTDVTERRRAEQRAQAQQAELAHVQRIATVGELTAQVAHEINQPLAAIVNFADGMALRLRDVSVDRDAMLTVARQIANEGRRAAEVIRRLREFVRKGAIQAEASDVNGLVQEVVHLCEADAHRHGVTIRLQLDEAVGLIGLDRIQIQQVVMNLLRNGLDAVMAPGAEERAVTLTTRSDAPGGVLLSVRDTGVGLPPGAAEQVFDAFFTTKRDGLGIGLAISRSIVEAHGGRLWAERDAARGTIFYVSLRSSSP